MPKWIWIESVTGLCGGKLSHGPHTEVHGKRCGGRRYDCGIAVGPYCHENTIHNQFVYTFGWVASFVVKYCKTLLKLDNIFKLTVN